MSNTFGGIKLKPKIHISSITLAVEDLAKSIEFYEAVGLPVPKGCHPEDHIVIELEDNLLIVLYQRSELDIIGTESRIPKKQSDIILDIIVDNNEEVDYIIEKATKNGGELILPKQPQDYDGIYIYTKYFKDPDGHLWKVMSYEDYNSKLDFACD